MRTLAFGRHLRAVVAFASAALLGACGGGDATADDAAASSGDAGTPSLEATSPGVVKLARYRIDPAKVFVAGISSGGFAAVQMHVAHSATFKGAAVYAGGVYWCAGAGGAATALANCGGLTLPTNQASYNSTLLASQTYLAAQSAFGTIDPASNLRGQPVYLWSGTLDTVVNPLEMADLDAQYRSLGAEVRFDRTFPAAHGWESPDAELACGTLGSPFMVKCDAGGVPYDSVKTWLTMFLGKLKPRNNGTLGGRLSTFDQAEFGASPNVSLAPTGSVFVPKACAQGSACGLVLALHGCLQDTARVGNRWVTEAGINAWADTNRLVVVYPGTVSSSAPGPTNPNACFDWWGYSNQVDPNYAVKSGLQMSVLYAMVERVTGRR